MEMPRNGTVPPRELHLHYTLHWQEIRSLWKIPHARAAKLRPEAAPPPSLSIFLQEVRLEMHLAPPVTPSCRPETGLSSSAPYLS